MRAVSSAELPNLVYPQLVFVNRSMLRFREIHQSSLDDNPSLSRTTVLNIKTKQPKSFVG